MKSPANGRGLMHYGLTQMQKGRYKEAKALFERARVYNPNCATLEINLGIVTNRLGDRAAAAAVSRADADARFLLMDAYGRLGRTAE